MRTMLRLAAPLAFASFAVACGGTEEPATCDSPCFSPPAATCEEGMRTTYASAGTCEEGTCVYEPTVTACGTGTVCGAGATCVLPATVCDGVACTSPPAPACDGDAVVRFTAPGTCSGETGEAVCDYPSSSTACRPNQICVDGECVRRPCTGVTCDEPPADTCEGNVVVVSGADGTCDPATEACVYPETRTDCTTTSQFCDGGRCVDADPCEGITCDTPPVAACDGSVLTTYAARGRCSSGECAYTASTTDCAASEQLCDVDRCRSRRPCEGVVCDAPPSAQCDATSPDLLRTFAATGVCVDDICDYTPTLTDCAASRQICVAGACVTPTPCDGVTCLRPPASFCDGGTAVAFANPGTCDEGVCRYDEIRTDCTLDGGSCVAGGCEAPPDPCDDVVCDFAPLPLCDGDIVVEFSTPGECIDGECSYVEDYNDCSTVGSICVDGACVDACTGVICSTPPAPTCDGSLLSTFTSGTCDEGACVYPPSTLDCAADGRVCLGGACRPLGELLGENDLYISEVTVVTVTAQWIEVGAFAHSGSVAGLQVSNGRTSFTLPAGLTVEPGGFLVLGASSAAVPGGPDFVWPAGFSLRVGDTLTLTGADLVDEVTLGPPSDWVFQSGTARQLSYGLSGGDNDSPFNWCDAPTEFEKGGFGTPGLPNHACTSPVAVGELHISEIMPDARRVAAGADQWFEIKSTAGSSVDLLGLRVETADGGLFVVNESITIDPGEYFVFGIDAGSAGGPDVAYGDALPINPAGDALRLSFAGTVIDSVDFSSGPGLWLWSTGVSTQLSSTVTSPAETNDLPFDWCGSETTYPGFGSNQGSPGTANAACPPRT